MLTMRSLSIAALMCVFAALLFCSGCGGKKQVRGGPPPRMSDFRTSTEPIDKEISAAKADVVQASTGVDKVMATVDKVPKNKDTAPVVEAVSSQLGGVKENLASADNHLDSGKVQVQALSSELAKTKESFDQLGKDNEKLQQRVAELEDADHHKAKWILISIGIFGMLGGVASVVGSVGFGFAPGIRIGVPSGIFGVVCLTLGLYLNTIVWVTALVCIGALVLFLIYVGYHLLQHDPKSLYTPKSVWNQLKKLEAKIEKDVKPSLVMIACILAWSGCACYASEVQKTFEVRTVVSEPDGDVSDLGVRDHGTGFYVGKNLVMTAAHVIEDAKRVYLVKGGKQYACKILVNDKSTDVCVLECESSNDEWYELLVVGDLDCVAFPKAKGPVQLKGPPVRFVVGLKLDQGASGSPVIKNDAVIGMVVEVPEKAKDCLCYAVSSDVLSTYLKKK